MTRPWDVIVIGAGPAGSIAARELARRGLSTLLLDKSTFPRPKVCGCCLNSAALATLDHIGLGHLPASLGAAPINTLALTSPSGRRASVPLTAGMAISRERLDASLIQQAVAAGATFQPGVTATVGPVQDNLRSVQVRGEPHLARLVIAADGLAGTSLSELPDFAPVIAPRSRIGIGAVVDAPPSLVPRNTITMICGRHGYLGAVWLEDGRLDLAAAVDPAWLKSVGGPQPAISHFLSIAGISTPITAAWRGTPALTRRRRVESHRLLVIGDAAGYIEPFTGEGMAWAMSSAVAAADHAAALLRTGHVRHTWARRHRSLIAARQRQCRLIAAALRRPWLSSAAVIALAAAPALAGPIIRGINRPRRIPA